MPGVRSGHDLFVFRNKCCPAGSGLARRRRARVSGYCALNKVSAIWTLARVAVELGEDEDWLFDIMGEMEPEDGVIWVYGSPFGEDGSAAFTAYGVENLKNPIDIHRAGRS